MLRLLSLLVLVIPLGLAAEEPAGGGVVVIELFTSEGCSSCPPAERKVEEAVATLRAEGIEAYAAAYHVTIWDRLQTPHGVWQDPYATAANTRLQQVYSQIAPHPQFNGLVTPHVYVNGVTFAGGDFSARIHEALAATRDGAELAVAWNEDGELTYEVAEAPEDALLAVVLLEHDLTSQVTAGENHGKTFTHDHVVRWTDRLALEEGMAGSVAVPIPDAVVPANAEVLVFVQTQTLEVLAATALDLPGSVAAEAGAVEDAEPEAEAAP